MRVEPPWPRLVPLWQRLPHRASSPFLPCEDTDDICGQGSCIYISRISSIYWTLAKNSLLAFFFFNIYLFIFGCAGLCCCTQASSSCSKQKILSSCGAWASHCIDFSCCRAQALGSVGFINCSVWIQCLQPMGLVAPRQVESSWTRDPTHVPCIGRWTSNHGSTREAPCQLLWDSDLQLNFG